MLSVNTACVTIYNKETIIVFKKEKGTNTGFQVNTKNDNIERNLAVVFPENLKDFDRSIGLVEEMKEDQSGYNYRVKDVIGELKIVSTEFNNPLTYINLEAKEYKKESHYYDGFSMRPIYMYDYYGLDHTCQSIYIPEKDLYITNNHCISSDWECFGTKVGSRESEEVCDKILYTEKYYEITVFRTKGEKKEINIVRPSLDLDNKDFKNGIVHVFENKIKCKEYEEMKSRIDVAIDESNDIKLATYLYDCDGKIAKGFSGGPVVNALNQLYGILWGFYTLSGDRQIIVFIPLRYINYAVEMAEAKDK